VLNKGKHLKVIVGYATVPFVAGSLSPALLQTQKILQRLEFSGL
jgi:hypothetical protein